MKELRLTSTNGRFGVVVLTDYDGPRQYGIFPGCPVPLGETQGKQVYRLEGEGATLVQIGLRASFGRVLTPDMMTTHFTGGLQSGAYGLMATVQVGAQFTQMERAGEVGYVVARSTDSREPAGLYVRHMSIVEQMAAQGSDRDLE